MRDLWVFRTDVTRPETDPSGLAVQALDGGMGKVQKIVDRDSRTFVVINTGLWIFGKTIKVPAGLVSGIDLDKGVVAVDRTRRELNEAPGQSDDLADDDAHEEALARYYGSEQPDPPRPEAPAPAATAPGERSRAKPRAPRTDADAGIEPVAPDGDGDPTQTGAGGPEATGGQPESAPERAGGAEAASLPTPAREERPQRPPRRRVKAGTEDGPAPRRPRQRRVEPATEDKADASSRPAQTTPDEPEKDAAPSPAGTGTGAPPSDDRPAKTPTPGSRPEKETSPARSRTRTTASGPRRTRTDAPSTPKAEGAAPAGKKQAQAPSRSEPARGTTKRAAQRSKTSDNGQPFARYDAMTASEVVARLRSLSQTELTRVERYEQRGAERQTILKRVAALREKEPWRGYDRANVKEVKEKLATARADRVTAVRDYERRHRGRAGVIDAARRRLEDL